MFAVKAICFEYIVGAACITSHYEVAVKPPVAATAVDGACAACPCRTPRWPCVSVP